MRALVAAGIAVVALAGCGAERQDADEPEGEFALEVVEAAFPERQSVAERSTLSLAVRNTDDRELPNLAVTIETEPGDGGESAAAFARAGADPRLADAERPVWVLDRGPEGGDTAYTNTWVTAPLPPGRTRTLEWRVTAVEAGTHTVSYGVFPGLDGNAAPAGGQRTTGSFRVTIADTPVPARVNDAGDVVRGGD